MALEQNLTQQQELTQQQIQRLTAQQVLQVKLLEMPLAQLEQAVSAELCDNPALEPDYDEEEKYDVRTATESYNENENDNEGEGRSDGDDYGTDTSEAFEKEKEREERDDALDDALNGIDSDDRMENDYRTASQYGGKDDDESERSYGEAMSFYDTLMAQVADEELTPRQREIMEYLIGSLDNDGLLRKSIGAISDELAIYNGIDCTETEIEEVLKVLQTFEPTGIGARSLEECLLLQIAQRKPSPIRKLMEKVVKHSFEDFKKMHWEKVRQHLRATEEETAEVIRELRSLNPHPGASLGEVEGRSMQQVTPDFIVETADNGTVTFTLNNGDIPMLRVSPDYIEQVKGYQQNPKSLTRDQKEALLFYKEKVDSARGYIEAVEKRRNTMTRTMKTIIRIQHKFFEDGDEADLVPMTLKDVAEIAGLDISTISRVCNSKYADTRWGIFRLRHFFSEGYSVDGDEMSTRKIKLALGEIIKNENKAKPLSDDAIAKLLKEQGFPIARRTVAKYREQLGLPVARLRK